MSNSEGVILAAGSSERVGEFKLGMPLGNRTLLEQCIEGMITFCDRIIVVGGYQYKVVQSIVASFAKVESVYNANYQIGMFTSVKCGIRAVKASRFFLIPGDQPLIKRSTYQNMLETDADIVIPKYRGKKGHPVLLNSDLINEILAMPDDGILRDFIHRKEYVCIDVDDPGILLDIDNSADYQRIKTYYSKTFSMIN